MSDPTPGAEQDAAFADVVVVAAGSSTRMGGVDKVLAPVGGRPLLARTLEALAASAAVARIVVVAAPGRSGELRGAGWLPATVVAVEDGGPTRQLSVANGVRRLQALDPGGGDRPVLVHDGARPLVTPALVGAIAAATREHGAAIPVLPVAETLKRVADGLVIETIDRAPLAAAQTPQGVRRALLLEAWRSFPPEAPREFTDEAALLEACRIPVHAIPGEPANLKVTLPDDLRRVAWAVAPPAIRVGLGQDSHPFGAGSPLRLGGIELPGAPALAGHSDGDVVLHAIADALLGAAGLGDLGRLFPADARTPRGVASSELLAEVRRRLEADGLRVETLDVTIVGARPKLGGRLDGMRATVASLLGVDERSVNVKASTGNLGGDEGAGRAISAFAVATVRDAR